METNSDTASAQYAAPGSDSAELAAAKAKADENYNKFLYAMADFENYKKRIERQFADIAIAGKRSLLEKLLPVVDNLERALDVEIESKSLRDGLQSTLRGFEHVLASEGVKSYTVAGEPFDPTLADAIGTQKVEGYEDDVVFKEAQRGYKIGDEVLRPAKVIVSKSSG